jgi:hypothetical protein
LVNGSFVATTTGTLTKTNRQAMPNHDFSKWPMPGEIARVMLFLCSDDAKAIHGTALSVYGVTLMRSQTLDRIPVVT